MLDTTARIKKIPIGHLRLKGTTLLCTQTVCLTCFYLRKQCNNQIYLPWILEVINFYNLRECLAAILNYVFLHGCDP